MSCSVIQEVRAQVGISRNYTILTRKFALCIFFFLSYHEMVTEATVKLYSLMRKASFIYLVSDSQNIQQFPLQLQQLNSATLGYLDKTLTQISIHPK
jgi:hypothetical protein